MSINFATKESTCSHVGWIYRPTPICHSSYLRGHYSLDCHSNVLVEPETVIHDYEVLDATYRSHVPDELYRRAKLFVKIETT